MANQQRIETAYTKVVSGLQESYFAAEPAFEWYDHILALSNHLQVTYVIVVLHNQVINGGFDQYFSNGYGLLFAQLASSAYVEIGANKGALLINDVVALLQRHASAMGCIWGFRSLNTPNLISILNSPEVAVELDNIDNEYYAEYCSAETEGRLLILLDRYLQDF